MSSRVEILGKIVEDLKYQIWVESAYELVHREFSDSYESLDDFLWAVSIEATSLLLPNLDFGPNTQYKEYEIEAMKKLIVNNICIKAINSLNYFNNSFGK